MHGAFNFSWQSTVQSSELNGIDLEHKNQMELLWSEPDQTTSNIIFSKYIYLPYYQLFSRDFNFANLEWKYFAGLKFHDFDEPPFFKVNFANQVTGAGFFNFHFCILFNHHGIETEQAVDWNVQQCQQHSNILYTDISKTVL